MQREKIKPIIDVPMCFLMETVWGEESTSKFSGVEYRYNVIHEERPAFIYLPAEGRDAISRAQPQPGDFIELVKQKRNGRVEFSAQRLGDALEPAAPEYAPESPLPPQYAPARTAPPPPAYQPNYQPNYQNGPPQAPRRLAAPPPSPPPPPPQNGGYTNGHAHGYRAQAQPPRPEAGDVHPISQQMAGCLRWSFDAWEELRAYALSKGRDIEYSSEDVRATANTFYMRAGGRG